MEYVIFIKQCSKKITIFVEKELYLIYPEIFNDIFGNIQYASKIPFDEKHVCFIVDKKNHIDKCEKNSENIIYCNTQQDDWIFNMLIQFEEFVIKNFGKIVFHGACLQYKNVAVMIVGERGAGKSTLVSNLCQKNECRYVDDDTIFWDKEILFGLNMPIRLRQIQDNMNHIYYNTLDNEGKIRYLYTPTNKTFLAGKPNIILFAKYNTENMQVRKVDKNECFMKLLINTRHCSEQREMIKFITSLIKNADAYDIAYRDYSFVFDFLKQAISGN